MGATLVTGASGLIGRALAASLSERHQVVCLSRRDPGLALPWVRGDFAQFEDLRKLDGCDIDAVAHLGAVTGGCSERDGLLVNVEGTRCLMRYLMDRGCTKFVMASSIAVVGMQSQRFRPLRVPIPDDHPCLDCDGYGFSKYLMEEVTRYYQRQNPALDVVNLRLSVTVAEEALPPPARVRPISEWAVGGITMMGLSDGVRAFTLALEAPHKPGARVMNAVGPRAWVADPVADILRGWWGDDVDLSHHEQPGHEYDAVYSRDLIRQELGFEAQLLPPKAGDSGD
ncbi:MAG TPA: NAD(P)-dependent oxidoreductase [Armatimonadota bacterium]|jgi:UDP-glucose 4-epimerase